ncbi:hypothetical protein OEG86_17240 [Hoeflea alexandrii]|uniref:hypothetical protein n=1 Tax=Hoeflea alexandrii TaxID=288436 RepID=UPI002271700E|nr:hypothetical protein [Hoeflea alexandrii]MCY0153679.1 hypothetical protein [Hoeflea alexandrii]
MTRIASTSSRPEMAPSSIRAKDLSAQSLRMASAAISASELGARSEAEEIPAQPPRFLGDDVGAHGQRHDRDVFRRQ